MKGPSGRARIDVHRVWECPVCQRREYTGGDVVSRACNCRTNDSPPQQTWMRLLQDPGTSQRPWHAPLEPRE